MKKINLSKAVHSSATSYVSPAIEVVLVSAEHGYQMSADGIEGPSYDEEDVVW